MFVHCHALNNIFFVNDQFWVGPQLSTLIFFVCGEYIDDTPLMYQAHENIHIK